MWFPILLSAVAILAYLILVMIFFRLPNYQPTITLTPIFVINANIEVGFTIEEKKRIIEAMCMWQKATHGLVIFHLISTNAKKLVYNNHDETAGGAINFVKASMDDKEVEHWDEKYKRTVLGYAMVHQDTSVAFLVTDRMAPNELFRTVTAHEIGHLLGLKHNPKRGTIMFEFTNHMASYITANDIKELIYSWRQRLAHGHVE
jgi:hypothetical protein